MSVVEHHVGMTELAVKRACVAVMDNGYDLPPGWVEIQRDDSPDIPAIVPPAFRYDEDAAAWVSPVWRLFDKDEPSWNIRGSSPLGRKPEGLNRSLGCMVPRLDAIDKGVVIP